MGKLTIDECKRIISKGRRQLTEAQERIAELERILDLDKLEIIRLTNEVFERDELIRDLARRVPWSSAFYDGEWHMSPTDELLVARIRELGIEVDG